MLEEIEAQNLVPFQKPPRGPSPSHRIRKFAHSSYRVLGCDDVDSRLFLRPTLRLPIPRSTDDDDESAWPEKRQRTADYRLCLPTKIQWTPHQALPRRQHHVLT